MPHYLITTLILLASLNASVVRAKQTVNDITGINPIEVQQIIEPTSVEEIKKAVKSNNGPISIGGGRYSMGGQTATENSIQIDMRKFNKVLRLDLQKKTITVQSGIRWRDIQETIDPHNLSVQIMQTYSNFTVGGSLSVNVHGRYVGAGPLINSVESLRIVTADGNEVKASGKENKDLFFAAIGGYGAVGVITEATLNLVPNEKIRREISEVKTSDYKNYFFKNIRNNKEAVLSNGDIYPPDYRSIRSETWYRTDKPLTINERLIPKGETYWLAPNVISSISILPFGTDIRKKILEPAIYKKEVVTYRNYEASYDVAQLEPTTPRLLFTYVLQEYFVPIDNFEKFIPKMRNVFKNNNVNVLNVSIRHSPAQTDTFLTWAPTEVFSFVVYYKQATTKGAKAKAKKWTKTMIDEVISVGGTYYLPYQIHASQEQFQKAYPGYQKFFDVKKKYDSGNKFRNKLWDEYYRR
ncbi:MAG: FAD-binding oxidoreductase [Bdellovibrionaceae bacterium]|nr:FAD-binding oxidoreductase [Pseudobdellovibrionaceae bacterium]